MNGETTASVASPQPLEEWFLNVIACPACPQHLPLHLGEEGSTLICECGRYAYPVRDGVPILLVEEATLLDTDAKPDTISSGDRETS